MTMAEFWAVLEYVDNALHEQSGELLSELVDVVQRQQAPASICAVLLGGRRTTLPDLTLLSSLGVQHLYLVQHSHLNTYSTSGYVRTLSWLIQQWRPTLVATSATPNGRDWAPRVAAQLHLPYVTGCLG